MNSNTSNDLEVDIKRLWQTLDISGSIGKGVKGGLRRLTLSDEDKDMRDQFVSWCEAAGFLVRIDPFGNIFARRPGIDRTLSPILIGSHLDTQIAGGRYDGVLGVLAGLEVLRTLNDKSIETKRPIEIVCWTNEEGVRFQPPMLGSGAFAGVHDKKWVHEQQDEEGITFGAELGRIGYLGSAIVSPEQFDSYFELHIEQGPELDAEGLEIGIVTGGFTSFGAEIIVKGEHAHSGPTPMLQRKNALVGASIIISRLNEIGTDFEPQGRAAVCRIDVSPNKYGILPDRAEITIDVRHPEPETAVEMYAAALELVEEARSKGNVDVEVVKEWTFGDIEFDEGLVGLLKDVSTEHSMDFKIMRSAAGHDAYHLSSVVPSALIFTPCKDGITHNEDEHIEPGYTAAGVNLLLNAVLRRANA